MTSLPAEQREREVSRLADEEVAAPFDLSTGPVIRGRLLKVAAEEHVLLVTMHRIVADAGSIGIPGSRVHSALRSLIARGPPILLRHSRFNTRTSRNGSASRCRRGLQRQLAYWNEQLRERACAAGVTCGSSAAIRAEFQVRTSS